MMTSKRPLILLLVCSATILSLAAAQQSPSNGRWQAVNEAVKGKRPQTAIRHLEPIIEGAMDAENYDEAIKAIATKVLLESQIQGDKAEERITRLQNAMTDLPEPMQPMMELILANWYWEYFQQNRWRFVQRTQTTAPSGDDLLTWDLPRILAEIDRHFQAALQASEWLQSTPISDFDELLVRGSMPDSLRPTLYDFVVYNALQFYTAGEQAGSEEQDAFVLKAISPVFDSPEEFLAWSPKSRQTSSAILKTIALYQRLMAFHRDQQNGEALAAADLERLQFGYNAAVGEDKNSRYKAALVAFAKRTSNEPISAQAQAALASVLRSEEQLIEAHQVAQQGFNAFPESEGGKLCFNLIQAIEARELNVGTERVWNHPWPAISVSYRNLTEIHFRVVRYDWNSLLSLPNYSPQQISEQLRNELLDKRPTLSWSQELAPTQDYQTSNVELEAPDQLKPGFYFLIASADPRFGEDNNQVMIQEFWVSKLALVMRTDNSNNVIEGFVLDADTGEPIAGAIVESWRQQRVVRSSQWIVRPAMKTDDNGLFRFPISQREPCLLLATHDGHSLANQHQLRTYGRPREERSFERTIFFTDRSLYRPGQTIRFKGICVSVDHRKDDYKTLEGKQVTVLFEDSNRQVIAQQVLRANAYGSFSGSFTAPRDRLMGQMTLRDAGDPSSRVNVQVEEYKRPKFQVELKPPQTPARLQAEVQADGSAKAYTGAAIGGAQVKYRVVREVRYPIWWGWRCWWNPQPATPTEIANGTTSTNDDGVFTVPFTAHPDPSVSEKDEPTFRFTVYADVTDTTGETRSDQRVINIAYTAISASLTTSDWLTPDKETEIQVHTESPDGEPRPAKGTLTVYQLQQPARTHRAPLGPGVFRRLPQHSDNSAGQPDLANPNSWPLGEIIQQQSFSTDASGLSTHKFRLAEGSYRAVLAADDGFGKNISAILPIQVLNPSANKLSIKIPHLVAAPTWTVEPGTDFLAIWGTGYEAGRAFVEVEHRNRIIQSYWTRPETTQEAIEQRISEAMRGGFTLRITQVRENRAYCTTHQIDVPWTNKQLDIRWEHFVSKLKPGQESTWTAIITGPQAESVVAEMAATLYDESLDAYLPHSWRSLNWFRRDRSLVSMQFQNSWQSLRHLAGHFSRDGKAVNISYRTFPNDLVRLSPHGAYLARGRGGVMGGRARAYSADSAVADSAMFGAEMDGAAPMAAEALSAPMAGEAASKMLGVADMNGGGAGQSKQNLNLDNVSARRNLQETAFFFPHLVSDSQGRVVMTFTMPDALTRWKLLAIAHDNQLRNTIFSDTAVTSKDLMVEPLAPRFIREGDILEFVVKVTNQSPTRQQGSVRLSFSDARTQQAVDAQLGNSQTDLDFDLPTKASKSLAWRIQIPDGTEFLTYKAVGSTGRLSDGEEGYLPVLSRRVLVTESLPLPLREQGVKEFTLQKLLDSAQSNSLQQESLTLQMVSHPGWYGVMALPYLMEYPHDCCEQTFNRLYANALARHIATSDPAIRQVFDRWKATPALDSPLTKNDDLKAVLLEETPWVRQAQKESEARRNVGILFDDNRLADEMSRTLQRLSDAQAADGSWPWFPGGPPNDYITLYITTGFGRLRHLGADIDVTVALKSLTRLDTWIDEIYSVLKKRGEEKENHLTPTIALYLYGRSFFLDDQAIAPEHQDAVAYFLNQARGNWTQLKSRQSEAHIAIALKRFGDRNKPNEIMVSLKERSVNDEEMGMFWRDTEHSWWWFRAPIETQAMMIEAFDEVAHDEASVEACQIWLLKQKQTRDWKTTKATADAVYGLLLRGSDLLGSDDLVRVKLGEQDLKPTDVEAGTGFYEQRFLRDEIKPTMGHITTTKSHDGVAWGSLHWQYLEDMSKITSHETTPLKLKKRLFVKKNTPQGPVLEEVDNIVTVGDELVVRIELRTDRDMEYVHLKDQRGSGLEPLNVISGYRYQDGLGYYESTRDTATHFFIDYLPKGTYVFEYSTRVVHRGRYQSGIAEIQCMYAPEFNSHSESVLLNTE